MKEYEKLLQENENRKNMQKALNLVKLGLFNQEEQAEFDFTNKELITYGKKYKGVYDLYEDQTNGDLIFVYPLVENNKSDESFEIDLKPYAFNVITLESMNNEEYLDVLKADSALKGGIIKAAYITHFVFLILALASLLYSFGYGIYSGISGGSDFGTVILDVFLGSSTLYYLFGTIGIASFVLSTIAYRKYRNN